MARKRREREELREILRDLQEHARSYTLEELKSGAWFSKFIGYTLRDHVKEATLDSFTQSYKGLSTEEMVARRIERARRRAAIGSGLTAGVQTAAIAAVIGSAGAASSIGLPVSLAAFVANMLLSSRVQLLLAYDLSVIYGHPVDIDDPEDLDLLIKVAFGGKGPDSDERAEDGEPKSRARQNADTAVKMASTAAKKTFSYVGRRLFKQAVVRLTLPAASIPLSIGMSYLSAGTTARSARQHFRDRARVDELARRLTADNVADPTLLVEAIWLMVRADREVSLQEEQLLKKVMEHLEGTGLGVTSRLRELSQIKEAEVLDKLREAPWNVRARTWEAVREAAAIDQEPGWRERRMLKRIARACGAREDDT